MAPVADRFDRPRTGIVEATAELLERPSAMFERRGRGANALAGLLDARLVCQG